MSVSCEQEHSPQHNSTVAVQEERVDETMDISQKEAEGTMRALARVEGIFAGPSSGGAVSVALRLSAKLTNATIVAIICDRGDRYLSTGMLLHTICLVSIFLTWHWHAC
jgi:cysteine synthase B